MKCKDRKYWQRVWGHNSDTRPPRKRNIFIAAGWRCEACGAKEQLTRDHVVPKSLGGHGGNENTQILCKPCNEAKGDAIEVYTARKKVIRYAARHQWDGDWLWADI